MKVYRPLIYGTRRVLDPFREDEVWVIGSRGISNYFLVTYGLTQSQVWNLVNGYDKDHIHYCPICGKELKFLRLSKGFGKTCGSRSCSMKLVMSDPGTRSSRVTNLNSVSSQARGRSTQFKSQGSLSDPCTLYYSIEGDIIKYGITSRYLFNRSSWNRNRFSNLSIITTGTRELIADLEMQIKIELDNSSEYLPINRLNELLELSNKLYHKLIDSGKYGIE